MPITSQVGIALKAEVVIETLKLHSWINDESDEKHTSKEGALFIFHNIKWYRQDPRVIALYNYFTHIYHDVLIRESCDEFPENDDGNFGGWIENPWGLHKALKTELCYVPGAGVSEEE